MAAIMSPFEAVALLIAFLFCAYVVGRVLGAFEERGQKSRNAKTWAPLLPLLGDAAPSDGASLTGTYQQRQVRVKRGEKEPAEHGSGYNFELEMTSGPGGQDWQVEYEQKFVVFGERRGVIKTRDEVLRDRLNRAGVVEMIDGIQSATIQYVRYEQKRSALLLNEDVRPRLTPTPQGLQERLDLLLRLAEINERVNPA